MIEIISQPWPWYIAGPLIALVYFLMLYLGGDFGISGTYRVICSMSGAGKTHSFFHFNWKDQLWNIAFVIGGTIGGFIAATVFKNPEPIAISTQTITDLTQLGIAFDGNLAPQSIFSWDKLSSTTGIITMIIGGFAIGFGSRWAGGCTSGHSITGLANFQLPSLIAVIGFFLGGLITTHYLFPLIF